MWRRGGNGDLVASFEDEPFSITRRVARACVISVPPMPWLRRHVGYPARILPVPENLKASNFPFYLSFVLSII